MRSDGFALVTDVLKCKGLSKYSEEDLKSVVQGNDKQRFSFGEFDGKRYIRANQGHSMASVTDLETKRITSIAEIATGSIFDLPSESAFGSLLKSNAVNLIAGVVVHGTYKDAWELIKKKGLSRMNRNHIHFAVGLPGDAGVISGLFAAFCPFRTVF